MQIKVENGPVFPVDDRFQPINGFDAEGLPKPFIIETGGGLKVSVAGTGDASLESLDGKTPTLGQKTMALSSPVVLPGDQVVATGSRINRVDLSGVRPSNTTPYAAGDVVGYTGNAIFEFENAALAAGGTGLLLAVGVCIGNVNAAGLSFRMHFFSAEPDTPFAADNSPFALTYRDMPFYQGHVDLVLKAGGSSAYAVATPPPLPFRSFTGHADLYGQLEILSAYTPTSGTHIEAFISVMPNPAQ